MLKKIVCAAPVLAAVSSFAETPSTDWYESISFESTGFGDVIEKAAPVAIAVVVAVAGVRVFIKLINRGAGK